MCAKSCSSAYPEPQYDAFVAHSSEDRGAVEELVTILESRGVSCYDPDRDFMPGVLVIENMENGIALSRKTITYFTQNFLDSPRCIQERVIAEQKAVDTKQNVIVDVLVDVNKATLPRWLRMTTYVDKNSRDFLRQLLKALGVSDPDERADKAYEDLMQENMSLKEEKRLITQQYRKLDNEKQSWDREKQSLTNQLHSMRLASQALQKDKDSLQAENKRLQQRENERGQSEIVSTDLHQAKQQKLDNKEIQEKMEVQPTISLPAHWKRMSAEERYRLGDVRLEVESKEWREVEEMVMRTAGGVGGDIGWVYRIQNPTLYQTYQRKRWEMSHQDPDSKECTLYYRTTGWDECKAIMENGFRKGTKNKVSKPYGNGIYFMSTSKTALGEASVLQNFWGGEIQVHHCS